MKNNEVFLQEIEDLYKESLDNFMINIFNLHSRLALEYTELPLSAESLEVFEAIRNRMDEISFQIKLLKYIEEYGTSYLDIMINCLKFISNIQKKGD